MIKSSSASKLTLKSLSMFTVSANFCVWVEGGEGVTTVTCHSFLLMAEWEFTS